MSYAGTIIAFPREFSDYNLTFFNRNELNLILNMYGRLVSTGIVRDYAIHEERGSVAFSFFKRSSEHPAFRLVKTPGLKKKGGAYRLIGQGGEVLKRGENLKSVLACFEPKLFKLVKA